MMKENFGGVSAAPLGAGYSKIAAGAVSTAAPGFAEQVIAGP